MKTIFICLLAAFAVWAGEESSSYVQNSLIPSSDLVYEASVVHIFMFIAFAAIILSYFIFARNIKKLKEAQKIDLENMKNLFDSKIQEQKDDLKKHESKFESYKTSTDSKIEYQQKEYKNMINGLEGKIKKLEDDLENHKSEFESYKTSTDKKNVTNERSGITSAIGSGTVIKIGQTVGKKIGGAIKDKINPKGPKRNPFDGSGSPVEDPDTVEVPDANACEALDPSVDTVSPDLGGDDGGIIDTIFDFFGNIF